MMAENTSGDHRDMPTADELYAEASKLKNSGKLPEAVAQLEEILKIAPDHVLTHSALGVLLQKLGRPDEAISHARRVTELEPKDPFSFTQLSVICQRCGRIQEAEDAMAQAHMLQGRPH
jgi:Flp pilus assembly protein TadD